jgi:carboxylesterase type B
MGLHDVCCAGGDYVGGSSTLYQCANMVNYWDGKGIMVTTNYRLNVMRLYYCIQSLLTLLFDAMNN